MLANNAQAAAPVGDRGALLEALGGLDARDQKILARMVRRLAAIEATSGEAVALAVAERMEIALRAA